MSLDGEFPAEICYNSCSSFAKVSLVIMLILVSIFYLGMEGKIVD
jgi:hypothetical protein